MYRDTMESSGVILMKEAMLWRSSRNHKVRCFLCAHHCLIAPSQRGVCGVRENRDGILYTHTYGSVVATNCDPIEKKPLYHFLPGSLTFSIAAMGCNFQCGFCQNWEISQAQHRDEASRLGYQLTPDQIIRAAKEYECESIAYTYTEPTIFFEYAFDIARLAKKEGLANIFVTNGYMTAEALLSIAPYLDACNVDLKSFQERFYRKICHARLEPVLETIRRLREVGIWTEVTTLVVPHENDSPEELAAIAGFIAEVDRDIPWHISRFYPTGEFSASELTPLDTMEQAFDLGKKNGLHFVYLGNVPLQVNNTECPRCGQIVITRNGYSGRNIMKDSTCPQCGALIAGKF